MPVIVLASSKGGAGKTTGVVALASELAQKTTVSLIDADPNQHSAKWAKKAGCPSNITLVENSTEETIIDDIDEAQEKTPFVLVDLEGTASMAVASAISRADLVLVPCQGSQDDADEAAKTIKLINRQSRVLNRPIRFAVFMTRTSPAITPRGLTFILEEFKSAGVRVLESSLIEREAFRAVRTFGGILGDLNPKQVSGIDKAEANSRAFLKEVIGMLESQQEERKVQNA
jgi:chromosome partitioning protein